MTFSRLVAASTALLIAVASFASSVTYIPGSKQPVRLKKGDTLIVELPTVSSGGYGWEPAGKPNRILKMSHMTVRLAKSSPSKVPIVGAPTTTLFAFTALKRGSATIALIYGRPWMLHKGGKPDKTLNIAVIVR
jgi:predicted secreted protein